MPRRAEIQPRQLEPDAVHGSVLVSQLVNRLMLAGKKSVAEQIVYDALAIAGEKTGKAQLEVLEEPAVHLVGSVEDRIAGPDELRPAAHRDQPRQEQVAAGIQRDATLEPLAVDDERASGGYQDRDDRRAPGATDL